MIDLYMDLTPNGLRASLILEETALAYRVRHVDLAKGDQHTPAFQRLNPAKAIPVIVDSDGPAGQPIIVTQSCAIVLYAAEKAGRLLPADPSRRIRTMQWFMQIATDITSASSWIFNHATAMPEKRDANAVWLEQRLMGALSLADAWLADHEFFADELSVADFLLYPNFAFRKPMLERMDLCPHLRRWGASMAQRPTVSRGMAPDVTAG